MEACVQIKKTVVTTSKCYLDYNLDTNWLKLKAAALCSLLGELIAGQHLKSAHGIIVMSAYVVCGVERGGGHRQAWLTFLFAHINQIFLLGAPGEETA